MKVQLIVVQGKPEGKTIPLLGPVFRIGRGETCHLRPNSEQVSREHAEFTISAETVVIRDFKSRNGTLVNGRAITDSHVLKDRDLVRIGPLTFAVSIEGVPTPAAKAAPVAKPAKPSSSDDLSWDDINSWLIADSKNPTPVRPSGVSGGDMITIAAFKGATLPKAAIPPPTPEERDDDYERLPEGEPRDEMKSVEEVSPAPDRMPEEFIDESNPFNVKTKKKPETPATPIFKDTSDVASAILRKMMERRRSSK